MPSGGSKNVMPQLQPGQMNERITLFSVTGGRVEQVIGNAWAKVDISAASAAFSHGHQVAEWQLKAWTHYRTDVTPSDRLRLSDGTEWEITNVRDSGLPRRPRSETEITAKRLA